LLFSPDGSENPVSPFGTKQIAATAGKWITKNPKLFAPKTFANILFFDLFIKF
jgi:hypothetical protein